VALEWGVAGYLWSGAIAGGIQAVVVLLVLFARGPWTFDRSLGRAIASFALPISIAALASLAMHQADLWVLRLRLHDLSQVGLYAFAYAIVQRSNGLLLTPFGSIWSARLYEIDTAPHRRETYHRVFRGFTLVSGSVLLALALCSRPIVELLASPEYGPAAALVPILCIGFFLFSLHGFFVVPALLAGRGGAIAWTAVAAAAVGVTLCFVLAPVAGIRGAAIASLVTYAVYALGGHVRYRRFENLRYPWAHLVKLASIAVVAWVTRPSLGESSSLWVELGLAVMWSVFAAAVALLWCGRDLLRRPPGSVRDPTTEPVVEGAVARQEVEAVEALLG
jgi:O-antigen/teichoic acid export membrane protein